jgi:AcrR family transcriptional regulator
VAVPGDGRPLFAGDEGMTRHCDSSREKIIDAAELVVIEQGAKHLTFDAVSAKSGVSRGGLLYHFPDKDALLEAMLERVGRKTKDVRARKQAELPEEQRADAASVAVLGFLDEDDATRRSRAAALFAIVTHRPELLTPLRESYRSYVKQLSGNGLTLEKAAIIALATDGLRFLELLSMSPFTENERGKIVRELLALAQVGATRGKKRTQK